MSLHRLHLANIYKPGFDIPLETDIVIELKELNEEYILLIQKGVFIEE